MEKYGTDRITNLIAEETLIMRKISDEMSSDTKSASVMNHLERHLLSVREEIRRVEAEKIKQD